MRYAVISDIHSNLEALTAVLKEIDSQEVNETISLGDLVGYNSNPNECVDIIRERGVKSLMGNHDIRACGLKEPDDFNSSAKEAILWTKKVLSQENLDFLKSQPKTLFLNEERGMAIHGSLKDYDTYILSPFNAMENFMIMEDSNLPPLCFFGHTHVKIAYIILDDEITTSYGEDLHISDKGKYLINPGSVGQPRDMDPRASFLIYDTEEGSIYFHKVEYDIDCCCRKIVKAGLPKRLAERLTVGW